MVVWKVTPKPKVSFGLREALDCLPLGCLGFMADTHWTKPPDRLVTSRAHSMWGVGRTSFSVRQTQVQAQFCPVSGNT